MVKRLFAVASGAAMLGATAMGALANDLNTYPDMFVTDGTFNGFFVVGENANPIDNLAMTDIVAGMKYKKADTAVAGETVTVTGDAWKAETSTKKLEMASTNTTLTGEGLYDIETWIGKDELDALGDGSYTTNAGNYGYTQYLYFDLANNEQNEIVVYTEDDEDVTADFFYVKNGGSVGQYKLEFSSVPESTIQDASTGSASTTGLKLDDFENTKLTMFGKEYTIVLARRMGTQYNDQVKLTLMGGASNGNLLEGESQTITLAGKSYDVALTYTDSTYAKFTVNGEASNKLAVGDTYKLSDGKEIGLSEVLYQSYAGGVHSAKFFLGASKLVMQDSNISDSLSSNELTSGSDTVSGASVFIQGTDDDTTFRLTTIAVNMTAQDDYYVAANKKLSEAIVAQDDKEALLFTNNWDMEYKGLEAKETHEIKVYSSTDRKYGLQFYDGDNNKVNMPLVYANSTTQLIWAEEATSKAVIFNEGLMISKDDYFVLTSGDASAGTAKTYVLQYKGADKSTATSPKIRFKNLGSSETLEYAVDTSATNKTSTIKLGGNSFEVLANSTKGISDFPIRVDLAGDDVGVTTLAALDGDRLVDFVDYYGANMTIANQSSSAYVVAGLLYDGVSLGSNASVVINLATANTQAYDNMAPLKVNLNITPTTGPEVTFGNLQMGGAASNLLTPEGEENIAYGYSTMGGKLTHATPSSSPAELTYDYPVSQRLPQVYVTSGAVSSSSASGTLTPVAIVDATKLDSEVADYKAQNLIVVGGPCVNTVAAQLVGSTTGACAEGFTPGKAKVKLFENGDKVAMLVAGYSGADTRLAGQVIAHKWTDMSGKEVEIEGTTYTDATIGAPSVATATTPETITETTTTQ